MKRTRGRPKGSGCCTGAAKLPWDERKLAFAYGRGIRGDFARYIEGHWIRQIDAELSHCFDLFGRYLQAVRTARKLAALEELSQLTAAQDTLSGFMARIASLRPSARSRHRPMGANVARRGPQAPWPVQHFVEN